eukprot:155726-Amphidinium_carterae.1
MARSTKPPPTHSTPPHSPPRSCAANRNVAVGHPPPCLYALARTAHASYPELALHKPKQLQTSSTVPTCLRQRATQRYAHGSDRQLCTYLTNENKLLTA